MLRIQFSHSQRVHRYLTSPSDWAERPGAARVSETQPELRAACPGPAATDSQEQQSYRVSATKLNLLGIALSFCSNSYVVAPPPQWPTCHSSCWETATDQTVGWAWSPLALFFMDLSCQTLISAFAFQGKVCILQWHLKEFILVPWIKLIIGRTSKPESTSILQRKELERRFKENSFIFCFVPYFVLCYVFVLCVLLCYWFYL